MSKQTDWCSCFPEHWVKWESLFRWKIVYIGNICRDHDRRCGSHGFYRDLWNERIVGAVLIATVASIACWVKYPKLMWSKL